MDDDPTPRPTFRADRTAAFLDAAAAGRLDRRDLLRGALALGLSLPALSHFLARRAAAQATPVASPGATPFATPVASGPPLAPARPQTRVFSGVPVDDPYAWLEDPTNPEVIAYLEAENAYREAVMAPTAALQETLYQEILGRIQQTDVSVPTQIDDWFYYSRTEEGQQYPLFARRRGTMDAPEEILLDLNAMVGDSGFIRLNAYYPSPDHRYLAFNLNETGGIEGTLYVKDLQTSQSLPEQFTPVEGTVWANDSRTFFYTKQDAALRSFEFYRHTLGTDPAADPMLYREENEIFGIYPGKAKDDSFLFLGSYSFETSEVRILPADQPDADWTIFAPRREGIIYALEHFNDEFLILTDEDAPNFKLMAAPVADPAPATWREVIPHRANVLLEGVDPFERYIVLSGREDGQTRIWIREITTGGTLALAFEEAVYSVFPNNNVTFATTKYQFWYSSLVTPASIFEHDLATGARTLLKQEEVLGGHDPSRYLSERLFATADDGTRVPISLVRLEAGGDGQRPLVLDGYGSYGYSNDPYFDSSQLSLLDRGVTLAVAHIRGGQELGRAWYEDGKLLNKKNTFTDYIACAQHLVDAGYTAPGRLAARGGSAGGLLMGAVVNLRPDLFRAILAQVPFVDVLRVMLDPTLPLTTAEFEEWGNPTDPTYYDYIKSYSPYDNVAAKPYPSTLITGGIEDDQVPYWQPAKWTAKLRALKTDDNLLLLRMNMGAGHSGASGRYDQYREAAHDMAYLLLLLDLSDVQLAPARATPVARAETATTTTGGSRARAQRG